MQAFTVHSGKAAPLYLANIDTDQIIPKQFLTRIERTGYGQFLFNDWRKKADGSVDEGFVLERPEFRGASVLIGGPNFGCGSSREHAAWSLLDFGIRAVIAPSFGDIFYNNSLKNGLLPVMLDDATVRGLADAAVNGGLTLEIDLAAGTVGRDSGTIANFAIDEFRRELLLKGLDDIGITLEHSPAIAEYERKHPSRLAAAAAQS